MTTRIGRNQATWILLAIAIVGFAVAIASYVYLIASSCESSGAAEFFSAFRSFHTQAGC